MCDCFHKSQSNFHLLTLSLVITLLFSVSRIMEINLDGLTLSDAGITMNMEPTADNIAILDHCLIGRVLTDKEVRVAYLRERLGRIWRLVKGVTIFPSKDDRFLFQFNHRLDAENVLNKGPWGTMVVTWWWNGSFLVWLRKMSPLTFLIFGCRYTICLLVLFNQKSAMLLLNTWESSSI